MMAKISKTLSPQSITGLIAFLAFFVFTGTSRAEEDHVGSISAADLLGKHQEFNQEYQAYEPNTQQLQQIKLLADKEVTVLFGTWCHDSKREVPRLLKLLDQSSVELASLTLFGVDRNKQDPVGLAQTYDLRFTPTIIISDSSGVELGRIIEKPENDLAADLARLLTH